MTKNKLKIFFSAYLFNSSNKNNNYCFIVMELIKNE